MIFLGEREKQIRTGYAWVVGINVSLFMDSPQRSLIFWDGVAQLLLV